MKRPYILFAGSSALALVAAIGQVFFGVPPGPYVAGSLVLLVMGFAA